MRIGWLLLLVLVACERAPSAAAPPQTLTFVMRLGPSTCYKDSHGQLSGMAYDLATQFAKRYAPHARLKFILAHKPQEVIDALLEGRADIAADNLVGDAISHPALHFTAPYQTTRQALVFNATLNQPSRLTDIAVSQESYARLAEPFKNITPPLKLRSIANVSSEELLEEVAQGRLATTVANQHVLSIMQGYYPHLQMGMTLNTSEPLAWAVGKETGWLVSLNAFFANIAKDGTLLSLLDRYYAQHRLTTQDVNQFLARTQTLLPRYASLFQQAQRSRGVNWHLLAAISYQESHWDPNNTSPTQVRGLMMLTENTAQDLGVKNRLDPQQSIDAAARYFAQLKASFPVRITEAERSNMALAAYNIGRGHLEDARILAQRLHLNPDSWLAVKKTLLLLNNPKYFTTLKGGYANGGTAVIFVESVRDYERVLMRALKDKMVRN